jgi:hypothetical protein
MIVGSTKSLVLLISDWNVLKLKTMLTQRKLKSVWIDYNRDILNITESSPGLWASFHDQTLLSVVSCKVKKFLLNLGMKY